RPRRVPPHVGAVASTLEQKAGAKRMFAGREVEVVRDVGRRVPLRAVDLRAARIERVEDEDGGRMRRRRKRDILRAPLPSQLVEQRLANRAGNRTADEV